MLWGTRSKVHQLLSQVFSFSILILVRQSLAFCKFTGQSRDLTSLLNFILLLWYWRSPCSTTNIYFLTLLSFFFLFLFIVKLKYFVRLFYNLHPIFFEHVLFCQYSLFSRLKFSVIITCVSHHVNNGCVRLIV